MWYSTQPWLCSTKMFHSSFISLCSIYIYSHYREKPSKAATAHVLNKFYQLPADRDTQKGVQPRTTYSIQRQVTCLEKKFSLLQLQNHIREVFPESHPHVITYCKETQMFTICVAQWRFRQCVDPSVVYRFVVIMKSENCMCRHICIQ